MYRFGMMKMQAMVKVEGGERRVRGVETRRERRREKEMSGQT
jgi:hypothetical protein